jgi:hypothetical protein
MLASVTHLFLSLTSSHFHRPVDSSNSKRNTKRECSRKVMDSGAGCRCEAPSPIGAQHGGFRLHTPFPPLVTRQNNHLPRGLVSVCLLLACLHLTEHPLPLISRNARNHSRILSLKLCLAPGSLDNSISPARMMIMSAPTQYAASSMPYQGTESRRIACSLYKSS